MATVCANARRGGGCHERLRLLLARGATLCPHCAGAGERCTPCGGSGYLPPHAPENDPDAVQERARNNWAQAQALGEEGRALIAALGQLGLMDRDALSRARIWTKKGASDTAPDGEDMT